MKISTSTGEFEITETLIKAWRANWPAVDVELELARMHLWLMKNAARRPVRPIRFIETWFKRCKPKMVNLTVVDGKVSERELMMQGKAKGVHARPGETYAEFERRVRAA